MITQSLISAGLLVQLLFATAVAFAQEGVMPAWHSTRAVDFGEYRIGPEDELQISVWKNDAMSRTVPVRPDGMISLPLLNDVRAAGLTPMQLRDVLINKLAEYMPNPEVSVIVKEMRSFKASVIGEVKRPKRIDIVSPTTVLDAIALAEGFSEFASRSRIVILRLEGKTMKRILFNYNKVISDSGEHHNLVLQPGDIVVVP
ncbi:MAG: polysaccharide biosynthesis/export family protein [Acidobacteria bacterium]|nr:polysaccharide biosynthesis/export family protein [Acidobacteriota bacterium]